MYSLSGATGMYYCSIPISIQGGKMMEAALATLMTTFTAIYLNLA